MNQITDAQVQAFQTYLINEERSSVTVSKYLHDVTYFLRWMGERFLCKDAVLSYKEMLQKTYAVSSANSMLAALNQFFRFCNRPDLCVKQFKVQRAVFCPTERELSKEEYRRLITAAERKKNERLSLVIQTICGTGIRVSELSQITAEAVKRGRATVSCKGKTRTVFIVSALQKRLLCYARAQRISSGAIFVTKQGNPMNRCNIWKEMKCLCSLAQVSPQKVFPHNLRHLFARTFYRMERDIAKLADILVHSSINTTRIYIIATGREHQRRMENMHLIL